MESWDTSPGSVYRNDLPKSGCGGGKEEDKKETDFEFDFCGPEVRTY